MPPVSLLQPLLPAESLCRVSMVKQQVVTWPLVKKRKRAVTGNQESGKHKRTPWGCLSPFLLLAPHDSLKRGPAPRGRSGHQQLPTHGLQVALTTQAPQNFLHLLQPKACGTTIPESTGEKQLSKVRPRQSH
jgi:hypothetical protein